MSKFNYRKLLIFIIHPLTKSFLILCLCLWLWNITETLDLYLPIIIPIIVGIVLSWNTNQVEKTLEAEDIIKKIKILLKSDVNMNNKDEFSMINRGNEYMYDWLLNNKVINKRQHWYLKKLNID